MKVIIAGGRNYSDYNTVVEALDHLLQNQIDIEIVSGACDDKNGVLTFTRKDGTKVYGADGLGERYAEESLYTVYHFPADWKKYGKSAGPIRNDEMAKFAGYLVAFWDGKSRGTFNIIETAKLRGLKIRIIKY